MRAHNLTARAFRERVFYPSQRIIEDTSDTVTIKLHVAGRRGLFRFILSWTPDVEVLEPDALRHEVAEAHRQALMCCGGDAK